MSGDQLTEFHRQLDSDDEDKRAAAERAAGLDEGRIAQRRLMAAARTPAEKVAAREEARRKRLELLKATAERDAVDG